jgi:hypothetical protein
MTLEQSTGGRNQWGKIVAQAWDDERFRKRLLADPAAVLKEHGVVVPQGIRVKVLEDTDQLVHLTLPLKPSSQELSDADLRQVVGGILSNDMPLPP